MRKLESKLYERIKKEIPDLKAYTPGLLIEVIHKGKLQAHINLGDTYRYYDLASLTKIIFSATAWMRWVSRSDFDLDLPAFYFLPWWRHRNISVRNLMT